MLLTVDQAASELGGVSPALVRKQVRLGRLPAVRVGRCVRIDPLDLARYVEASKAVASCSTSNRGRQSGGRNSGTPANATVCRRVAELRSRRQQRLAGSASKSKHATALVVVED